MAQGHSGINLTQAGFLSGGSSTLLTVLHFRALVFVGPLHFKGSVCIRKDASKEKKAKQLSFIKRFHYFWDIVCENSD